MKKSSAFNIALVPSDAVVKRAMRLSRELKKHGGLFTLNQRLYSTHVTLYMAQLPLQNIKEVRRILKNVAANTKSFNLVPMRWNQSKDGYIDVSFKKTKVLSELQKVIIKELNPLREGLLRQKDIGRLKTASAAEKRNIQKYGFRSVGAQFDPHLTITKLPAHIKKATPKMNPKKMAFAAREVGIFYLGEYGSCKRLVAKYTLER